MDTDKKQMQEARKTPAIEFPFEWEGRIIVAERETVHAEIVEVLVSKGVSRQVTRGNVSAGGRYATYGVSITFETREVMEDVTGALGRIRGVKLIL